MGTSTWREVTWAGTITGASIEAGPSPTTDAASEAASYSTEIWVIEKSAATPGGSSASGFAKVTCTGNLQVSGTETAGLSGSYQVTPAVGGPRPIELIVAPWNFASSMAVRALWLGHSAWAGAASSSHCASQAPLAVCSANCPARAVTAERAAGEAAGDVPVGGAALAEGVGPGRWVAGVAAGAVEQPARSSAIATTGPARRVTGLRYQDRERTGAMTRRPRAGPPLSR